MSTIKSFCISGAQGGDGPLSITAMVGECMETQRLECQLEWRGLAGVSSDTNMPDWLLAVAERLVEMYHAHEVVSFVTERGEGFEHSHAL